MRTALICLFFIPTFFLAAQNRRLDSLKYLASHHHDTIGVMAFADLCYEYRFIHQDSAAQFGRQAIALAKRIHYQKGLAQSYSDVGVVYYDKKELQTTLAYWDSSLTLRKAANDIYGQANLNVKKGAAYFQLGQFEKSLACQLEALRIYEQLHSDIGIVQALNNVAAVYEHQQQLDKALEYFQRSLAIKEKMKDQYQVGVALINIGSIYFQKKQINEAKRFQKKAITALVSANTRAANEYLGMAYNNLAEIYTQLSKYDSALISIRRAIEIRKSIDDYQGIVSSFSNLGRIEMRLKHYDNAERFLLQARDSANAKKLIVEQRDVYLNLYELYQERGNAKKALDNYVKYTTIKDSLLNETSHRQVTQMQVQYETEKKEQQIALQQSELGENQAKLQVTYIIIALLVVLVIASIVIFLLARSRHRRKHVLLQREKELSVRDAFIQASIESQESERKRFAQDLHDGMGQLISSLKLVLHPLDKLMTTEDRFAMVNGAESLLNDMHREIRSIAFNLMPQTLIQYGLVPALKEMADRINASGRMVVRIDAFDLPTRLSELQEVSLYRIIQEWTNNIVKYAGATVVDIQLVGHEDEINVIVEDNGKGFDPLSLENSKGNGWKNIRSRSNLLKGSLHVDSSEGRAGTTLSLTIPMTKSATQPAEKTIVVKE